MNEKETPMMKQYRQIKEKQPDAYLFFRCGDFYEMFGNDAVEASSILDIALTKRGDTPMCGVPYHSVDSYIAKVIKAGKKIAICEQMEDPKLAKGIVKRDVTQVITPGTLIEERLLANKSNNFLLALNIKGFYIEISYLDLSTGDFEVNEIELSQDLSSLKAEMIRINPKEIIIAEDIWIDNKQIREMFAEQEHILVNRYPGWYFEDIDKRKKLFKHFGVTDWKDVFQNVIKTDLTTPGVLLSYVQENARSVLDHIKFINYHNYNDIMTLDETTIKNLELFRNLRDGTSVDTLLEVLDDTVTPMGGRLLKKWLIEPLININKINKRLDIVEYLYNDQNTLNIIKKSLKNVMDLERLCARIVMDKANPKDIISIKNSLTGCNEIINILSSIKIFKEILIGFKKLTGIIELIENSIKEEPATLIHEGNIVKDGYNNELDELKKISFSSKEFIAGLEKDLKEKYNTPSLKIKYNKILGYFFEVSKLQSKNLDDSFVLRQSLVNTHRYTTGELSRVESKILTAREEINKIEEDIFYKVRKEIFQNIHFIQANAKIIAQIDVLTAFSNLAINNIYVKPVLNNGTGININEGRHPVVEKKLDYTDFIPNELDIDTDDDYLLIITGPNMSGKSTYLRQNAIIVLMAQIGCFVPASSCEIGIVDRIFTRIGTSDNLARGQSTFLVEMIETANILHNATNRSFIIMDEIGRGTSTYDGLSIAWSVLEYIHNKKMLGAKTLFATHYHELTALSKKKGIKNLSIAISEDDDNITFLHKIIEEPSQKSYGIHVASLANLPEEVIIYSKGLLREFEESKETGKKIENTINSGQMELFCFDNAKNKNNQEKILNKIKFLNINRVTPLEALNILSDIQKKL